jgi:hypothetical protein
MDEGIQMMPIEKTISEPRYPRWVEKNSIGEDMIVASYQLAHADNASSKLASGNAE